MQELSLARTPSGNSRTLNWMEDEMNMKERSTEENLLHRLLNRKSQNLNIRCRMINWNMSEGCTKLHRFASSTFDSPETGGQSPGTIQRNCSNEANEGTSLYSWCSPIVGKGPANQSSTKKSATKGSINQQSGTTKREPGSTKATMTIKNQPPGLATTHVGRPLSATHCGQDAHELQKPFLLVIVRIMMANFQWTGHNDTTIK